MRGLRGSAVSRYLRRAIRVSGNALRNRLPRSRPIPYRPRFPDDEPLVARLAGAPAAGFEEGATFFVDPQRIADLAHALRTSDSPWAARTLARVTRDRTTGLPVYSSTAPALDGTFPWGRVEKGPGDDVLYAVRPHRFAFAPRFALAILYEGISADVLADVLESWIAFAKEGASSYPYLSTLVVIQRSLALSWAYAFVCASSASLTGAGIRARAGILKILQADIDFLFPRLGTGHPNNHLLVERFAAWYFAVVFPRMIPAGGDLDELERRFVEELLRQTYPDGGGFEHSLHYHEFGCEMAAAYLLLCRRAGRSAPPAVSQRVRRMLEFQVELAGPGCVTLGYGNATEDPLFPLDSEEGYATAGLREMYRSLFRPDLSPAARSTPSIERAFWLLGGRIAEDPHRPLASTGVVSWPDSGFHLFSEPQRPARLVFRTGPAQGRHLMPGHMHSDLLGVYAASGAEPFLVDAGTWSYRIRATQSVSPDRRYFAGASAHNTLLIGDVDPLGGLRGDFRDGEPGVRIRVRRLAAENRIAVVECEMIGHALYGGHRRGIVHVEGNCWILYDRLPAAMPDQALRLNFQVSPDVRPVPAGHDFVIVEGRSDSFWIAKGSTLAAAEIVKGRLDPPAGWFSPRYGEAVPASQLSYALDRSCSSAALVFGFGGEDPFPVDVDEFDGCLAVRWRRGESTELLLIGSESEAIQVTRGGRRSEADVVWYRRTGSSTELRIVASTTPPSTPLDGAGKRLESDVSLVLGGREWQ